MDDPRESRERFVALAQEFVPDLVAERDGLLFVLPTDDATLSKLFVASEKHKEHAVLERLEAAGTPAARTTLLDVGANVGTTEFAALQCGFASLVACEPVPSSFRLLRANLVLNGMDDRVRAVEVAVSDRAGTTKIETGQGSRKARVLSEGAGDVRTARLDDLAAEGVFDPAELGLVLIDVEGHEPHVLDGGESVFGNGVPLIVELNPKLLGLGGRTADFGPQLARYYTQVLDLRDRGAEFVPVAEVPALIERYEGKSTGLLAVTR